VSDPADAFVAIDEGTATTNVALVTRVDGRWRLAGSLGMPAHVGPEGALAVLAARLAATGLVPAGFDPDGIADVPRLGARTLPPPVIVVLAATPRGRGRLTSAARRAGWHVRAHDLGSSDPLATIVAATRRDVTAILVGADDPPGADERALVGDLAAVVGGAIARRPELIAIYTGSMGDLAHVPGPDDERGPTTILAPPAQDGDGPEDPLCALLDDVRAEHDDGRRAEARSLGVLATVLDRRILYVDVGASGGLVARADPAGPGGPTVVRSANLATGALVPRDLDDEAVDAVAAWLPESTDRHRLRDQLVGVREDPYGGAQGGGALLRMAAARAAAARLAAAVSWTWRPSPPDLVLAGGGAWSVAPAPAVALALSDALRHDGVRMLGHDASRLLAPLGMVEDDVERAARIADLADAVVVPLGTVVMPALAAGRRSHGEVSVRVGAAESSLPLVIGGLELFDLPPGQTAETVVSFGDAVVLGTRGRRFAVEVVGGLGGLLIDLRGVPLTLPDNPDQRRLRVEAWQRDMWTGLDA
jgi:hypothetical protein